MPRITERIDATTLITAARREPRPPCPRSVKIELTGRCNFACTYCARSMELRDQRDMDWGLYTRLTRELRQAGVEELGLFYLGESFLLPWLDRAIRHAKREVGFPYVFLTTNGSLATAERVRACMAAGLDSLKFSLNYADAEQFTSVARVKRALFAQILANVRDARRVRDEGRHACGLYASYIAYDGVQGDRMKAVIADVAPYLDEIYALPLYSQANLVGGREARRGWSVRAGNPGRLAAMRDPIPCWALFTEARVTWDGKLSACCFDHDGRFIMGDLTAQSFMEAWHSADFRALREAHLRGDVRGTACERCVAWA
jgi:MoaA/NifB/PqqE/SkfB family radical SAM enzyme